MKILVTGATGFLGSHLIPVLLERGHEVIASGRNQKKAFTFSWYNSVKFIPYDISVSNVENLIFDFFDRPDVLIHLAWEGLPKFKDLIHIEQNLPAHIRFLKTYITSGGKHILVAGTCLEYGMQNGCLAEDMSVMPITSYGVAKNCLRQFIELLQQMDSGFIFQWVRMFYMFGEGQNATSIIPQLSLAIQRGDTTFNMSGGEQIRDYLPIKKVAEIISRISEQEKVTGIINCCSGQPITIKKLVKEFAKSHDSNIQFNFGYFPYTDYEPMNFWGNNSKLKKIIYD